MVTHNPLVARDQWDKETRVALRRLGSGSVSPKSSMSNKDERSLKKRESRSGTRKVSALSAEQLERKRANDREAQQSIRQRTKEHIELLEGQVAGLQRQVADLRPRSDRYDDLIQRNAALEDKVNRLKHQLTAFTGRSALPGDGDQPGPYRSGWPIDEPSNIPSTTTIIPIHLAASSHQPSNVPRAPSAMSVSSRSSHPHEWQPSYCSTRSPSIGDSSDTDFSARMDPYLIDGQMHQPARMMPPSLSIATSQLNFSNTASPTQPSSASSFSHIYPMSQHQGQRPEDQANQFFCPQRSISNPLPNVTASYPPSYTNQVTSSPHRDQPYPYQWVPQT
ncbi:hypothetical protein N7492_007264 [Penicillium capsulatum]|uniref:BZIP domain-containing protein n=1 Tax=Penicillium capsulatum TaxID=69766 RepID=A0A9W9HZI6_9EURO|nr:hypothetical protein N7492_007264 [Penicillium capsulatum]KAJ6117102.1 hypothetical protein N7512_006827 [Penicillium capsulatum]